MAEKLAAWCGMSAPVIFAVALAVFSVWTPGYSNLTNAVSELGATGAPHALAWNAVGHVLVGVLTAIFAWGLHAGMRSQRGAVIVPLLVGLSGIGSVGVGFSPAKAGFQPSTETTLHFVMVSVYYLPFILGAFVFPLRLRHHPYWKRWKLFSMVMGLVAIASFFIPATVPAGLSQRTGLGVYFLWVFVLGFALWHGPGRPGFRAGGFGSA